MLNKFLSDIKDELYPTKDSFDVREIIDVIKNKEHKRLNIYYILKLLYAEGTRQDFYNFLIEQVLPQYVTKEEAKNLVNYADAFIVDFNNYSAETTKTMLEPLSGDVTTIQLSVGDIVDKCWNQLKDKPAPVIDILDDVYQLTYPGYLHKVLLYKSEVKDVVPKTLVYTLHS